MSTAFVSPIFPDSASASSHCLSLLLMAFAIVVALTPLVRRLTLVFDRVDLPAPRKVHQRPTARTGGIAIFVATVSAISAVWASGGLLDLPMEMIRFQAVLWGSFCFFCIGLSDDLFELSAPLRLAMQGVIACIVWVAGVRIESLSLPLFETVHLGRSSLPITVVWLTGVVNAINWIDGLDGLAAGVSSIAATMGLLICLHNEQVASAIICSTLLGSLLGFLIFNFNPAQIFMGDGGSYFIGFLLAAISITGLDSETETVSVLLPVLLLFVPLFDMCLVILTRLYRGVSPLAADDSHLHHRLLQAGLTHRFSVLVVYVLTIWAGSLALFYGEVPGSPLIVLGATGLLVAVGHRAMQTVRQGALLP